MSDASETRELKATSLRFRSLASTALRSNNDDARVNIRRLLAFVDSTPLLRAELERAPVPTGDVNVLWDAVRGARTRLVFPDDPLEELGLLDALLRSFSQPAQQDFRNKCYMYAGKHGLQDSVTEVLSDTVGRYSTHLRQVVELALLSSADPAYGSRRVELHVSGGTNQLNVAHDSAQIAASQSVGADAAQVITAAGELARRAIDQHHSSGDSQMLEVRDIASAVMQTLHQQEPSQFTLRTAKEHLELLAASTTVASALGPHVHELAVLIARYLGL